MVTVKVLICTTEGELIDTAFVCCARSKTIGHAARQVFNSIEEQFFLADTEEEIKRILEEDE